MTIEKRKRVFVDVRKQIIEAIAAGVLGGIAIGVGCHYSPQIPRQGVPAPYEMPGEPKPELEYRTLPVPTNKQPGKPQNQKNAPEPIEERVNRKNLSVASFKHQDELQYILRHAERRGVEPELMEAIRMAENGKEYICGVLPNKRYNQDTGYLGKDGKFVKFENEKDKQYAWLASILSNRQKEYNKLPASEQTGFVSFVKKSYCPNGDPRDANGLNFNWEDNVIRLYHELKGTKGVN